MEQVPEKPYENSTTQGSERVAWRRDPQAQHVSGMLGLRVRERRERLGISLNAASELTGIPAATLSRIETNKMSPTVTILLKLMTGLRLPWIDLVGTSDADREEISISMPNSEPVAEVPGYAYQAPHRRSRFSDYMQPLIFDVLATSVEGAGGLRAHKGFELCYVLNGTLILYFEGQSSRELPAGASALFNCEIPHAYVSKGRSKTRVLNVTMVDPLMLNQTEPFGERFPN